MNKNIFLQNSKERNILSFIMFVILMTIVGTFVVLPTKTHAEGQSDFFVITQPPTKLDDFMSNFSGYVNNNDNQVSYVWFEAGRNGVFEISSNKQMVFGKTDFTNQIYHIEEGVEYVYRAAARHERTGEIKYGETKTFFIGDRNQTNTINTHNTNNQQTDTTNNQNNNPANSSIVSETATNKNDIVNNLITQNTNMPTSNKINTIQQNETNKISNMNLNWGMALREQFFSTDKKGTILVNDNLKIKKEAKKNLASVSVFSSTSIFPESLFGWVVITILLYLIISRLHYFFVIKKEKEEAKKKEQESKINNLQLDLKTP